MTNDTTLHEDGAANPLTDAAIAATIPTGAAADATPADPVVSSPEAEAGATGEPAAPAEPKPPSFDDLGLHPDVKQSLDEMGYFSPTPVQTAVFRPVSEGKDLLVQSRTGTGKTTAFGLPSINRLIPTHRAPQVLILAPTRELALQVSRELTNLGKHRGILVEPIYGGAPIGKQIKALRDGVHIVVGTPGRVLDHIGRRTLDCSAISTFILDECDEMLSMGFLEDIERVVSNLPDKKQTMLFSATMPDEVQRYARRHMRAPEQISLSRDSISVAEIHHAYYIVSGIARSRDLLKIIFAEEPDSAIIFCNMRDETTMVAKFLQKQGLDAEPLSSDLSQADRERVMGRMKQKNLRFLVATDVAARGIDISDLSHVINYSVPEQPEIYVHRTGRTGRAGKKGTALSMVGPRELGNFRYVRLTFGIKPEERLLPKDAIFVGKLKVPLPPVGTPQPPDPVQILIRGVAGTPTDLEHKIFEKLYATANGKRVLAQLVAERLDKLSTRTKPKRERSEHRPDRDHNESAEGGAPGGPPPGEDRGERRFDRDDRPRRFDRDGGPPGRDGGPPGRDERPRWRDGERGGPREDRGERRFDRPGGDRPGGDRPGGDRPDRGGFRDRDRGPRPDRGDRPGGDRPERSDRPPGMDRGDRPERSDRPGMDRGNDRPDHRGDRGDRPDRPERTDRGDRPDRPERTDRGDRPDRPERGERDRGDRPDRGRHERGDRDRGDRNDRPAEPRPEPIVHASTGDAVTPDEVSQVGIELPHTVDAPVVVAEARPERGDRDRDRDRDRGRGRDRDRDRDRGRRDWPRDAEAAAPAPVVVEEVGTEAAPVVEASSEPEQATRVDDVARAVLERKGKRGDKDGKKKEITAETREFWETWAEEKTTREPEPAAEPAAEASDTGDAPAAEPSARRGRDDKRGSRDRDRGGRDKDRGRSRRTAAEPGKAESDDAPAASDDKPAASRTKRDTTVTPPPTMEGAQARLFVSLGKKHGVSADDLRELLAAPIGGDKARIGSVSLRDSHAHVRVPEDLVDQIIGGVNGTSHNDHDVTVERSRA